MKQYITPLPSKQLKMCKRFPFSGAVFARLEAVS